MLHGFGLGEETGARNSVFYSGKVIADGDGGQLVCEAVAGTLVLTCSGSSRVFCNVWLLMCA